jgi:L-alanine-DL-glutamate epimerase-like enolase superfamily enzyme
MAMWDAFGKACGQPLYRLWGGEWRTRIPLARTCSRAIRAKLLDDTKRYQAAGYETYKLKIGYDEPSDIELTRLGARDDRAERAAAPRRQRRVDAGHRRSASASA